MADRDKGFSLKTCSFETDELVDPLIYIKEKNFFGHIEISNLVLFLEELPILHFDPEKWIECDKQRGYDEIDFMVCTYDMYNWSCHQAAPFFSNLNIEFDYIFGFAQRRLPSGRISTFLHSFNAKGENLIDPTIEVRCKKSIKRGTDLRKEDFFGHMGIRFPIGFATTILLDGGEKEVRGNVWGYLLNEIFCSRENTIELIELIKNHS